MSVRVMLCHYGLSEGSLVIDNTDNKRSKPAKTLAHLHKLRDKESRGYTTTRFESAIVVLQRDFAIL